MSPPADEQLSEAVADSPRSFSYKIQWFAFRTEDTAAVATGLCLVIGDLPIGDMGSRQFICRDLLSPGE